jgi:antitoxin (DNA-binding transcriptional repressor) of toxin-antitoxin stability system
MKKVKIADAKANLSRHLEYVRRGGRIRILDRDVPVADLIPIEELSEGEWLADLERRGVAGRGKGGALPRELLEPGPPDPRGRLLGALLEERRGGR